MRVIGTAGHVDHGKSTLVEALSGIDPDRLREEKERQMTIDLGFAWLTLPSGQEVSIVDVPGHEDFIKNMLAGVGGIDVALFVIAADEGVMPQTREHLAILDLLEVRNSIVALTKQDLIDDPEWLLLVEEDVREQLAGTCLEDAPIIPVSAQTGQGLEALLAELDRVVADSPPKRDINRPRLPIDRAFSLSGFGTVVTGTLADGHLRVGAEVEVLPKGLKSRIRGLQTHKQKLEQVVPGSRVAANLVGLSTGELERGDVVAYPGQFKPTRLLDTRLRLLESAPKPLRHNQTVDFYIGASVIPARIRVLGQNNLEPGQEGWAQIAPYAPVVALKGDRFIIRQPSPSVTIGGGRIVNPLPVRRHRRFRPETIQQLETLARGTPAEIILETLSRQQPLEISALLRACQLETETAREAIAHVLGGTQIIALAGGGKPPQNIIAADKYVLTVGGWAALLNDAAALLRAYHEANPLRSGMPRSELQSRLRMGARLFNDAMTQAILEGRTIETPSGSMRLPEHEIRFTPSQQARIDALLQSFRADPYKPPSAATAVQQLGEDVLNALIEQRVLVKASDEVLFLAAAYDQMVAKITHQIRNIGPITLAQVRDMFNTSRRYATALLEHLDERRITRRVGDERILRAG